MAECLSLRPFTSTASILWATVVWPPCPAGFSGPPPALGCPSPCSSPVLPVTPDSDTPCRSTPIRRVRSSQVKAKQELKQSQTLRPDFYCPFEHLLRTASFPAPVLHVVLCCRIQLLLGIGLLLGCSDRSNEDNHLFPTQICLVQDLGHQEEGAYLEDLGWSYALRISQKWVICSSMAVLMASFSLFRGSSQSWGSFLSEVNESDVGVRTRHPARWISGSLSLWASSSFFTRLRTVSLLHGRKEDRWV